MAIISIMHRASGVLLFLLLPLQFYMLHESLTSKQSFDQLAILLTHPLMKFLVWAMVSAMLFHLIAGVRHLIMDIGFGESLQAGRNSAIIVLALTLIVLILTGVWLW